MKITIDLSSEQLELLRKAGERFGVKPEELARATLADLLEQPREDFEKAARLVLRKNRELYERLK